MTVRPSTAGRSSLPSPPSRERWPRSSRPRRRNPSAAGLRTNRRRGARLAQVATFQTASSIPAANFRIVLNDRLPAAIRVLAVDEMPADFHARHSARAKLYHYRIWRGDVVPPFLARSSPTIPIHWMSRRCGRLPPSSWAGTTSPRSPPPIPTAPSAWPTPPPSLPPDSTAEVPAAFQRPSNVRTVHESRFERSAEELVYIVRGSGFLHHMVRNLVGTFLLAGKGGIAPTGVLAILEARDRRAAGPTAPAEGLYLVEVEY